MSTPHIRTPPLGYGGSEAVAGSLAEELAQRGFQVTLFATPDSSTAGVLRHFAPALSPGPYEHAGYREVLHLCHALASGSYDLVLNHCLQAVPVLAASPGVRALTSLHYRPAILGSFPRLDYVAISHRQAELCRQAGLNVVGVVPNGIDTTPYHVVAAKESYLLWIGRFHAYKGPDLAIQVARRLGMRLILAGPPPPEDQREYFEARVRPYLGGPIEWVGGVEGPAKRRLFERARCTLCPIRWEEPFGLVMVESMAAGTPVIAFRRGAAPEVVADGRTGFVVDDVDGMAAAVERTHTIDPYACRQHVEEHFTAAAMADGYLSLAYRLIARTQASAQDGDRGAMAYPTAPDRPAR